jgi:phosphopantetheinyl transferase
MNDFEIPRPGEIHIYRVISEGYKNILSCFEKDRYSSFSSDVARKTYLKGHSAARFITAKYTGKNPSSLDLATSPEGKPSFQCTPNLNFNLSHSSNSIFIAFSSEPVGFDIENVQRKADFQKLAERYFQPAEKEVMKRINKSEALAFLEIWTAKEAILKLVGKGIASGLDKTLVLNKEEGLFDGIKIHFYRYLFGDFLGTLASFSKIQSVQQFTY